MSKTFLDVFSIPVRKKTPAKSYVWMYQFEGGKPEEITKHGRWWHYNNEFGSDIGCDTLAGAKGDLIYSGAKVWRELR